MFLEDFHLFFFPPQLVSNKNKNHLFHQISLAIHVDLSNFNFTYFKWMVQNESLPTHLRSLLFPLRFMIYVISLDRLTHWCLRSLLFAKSWLYFIFFCAQKQALKIFNVHFMYTCGKWHPERANDCDRNHIFLLS